MVICMYMCLWAGSCIKKWMVKRGLGYFLVLGGGTFILLRTSLQSLHEPLRRIRFLLLLSVYFLWQLGHSTASAA